MGKARGVTEPAHQAEEPNLHPGQHDEGGTGGMATRELAAHQAEEAQGEDVEED
jgi:hypothetical protein